MEKVLSKKEILINLINQAKDPFISCERKTDIKRIVSNSTTMNGINHLFMASCYFSERPLFYVNYEEALQQANLALKENNSGAYYFLYLLLKDKDKKMSRNYLILSCECGFYKSYLEIAKLKISGELFEQDLKGAQNYLNKAIKIKKNIDTYFYSLLIASLQKDKEKQLLIIEEATKDNFFLPGYID